MAGVNKRILRTEIERQSDLIYKKIKPRIKSKFEEAKAQLLQDFDDDEVTQEIAAGPEASSSFVSTIAGGNLFSLLGFYGGQDPTADLRNILKDSIHIGIQYTSKKNTPQGITWNTPVYLPTMDDIDAQVKHETPLAWSPSRAWTTLIEKGIPWFSHYLFDEHLKLVVADQRYKLNIILMKEEMVQYRVLNMSANY
jgi:hypothetical protein